MGFQVASVHWMPVFRPIETSFSGAGKYPKEYRTYHWKSMFYRRLWRALCNVAYGSWEGGSPVTSLMLPINVNTPTSGAADSTQSGRIGSGNGTRGLRVPFPLFRFPSQLLDAGLRYAM